MNWLHILRNCVLGTNWALSTEHAKISVNILRSKSKWSNDQCVQKDERKTRATWGLFDLLIEWMRIEKQKTKKDEKHLTKVYIEHIDMIGAVSIDRHVQCSVFIALDIRLCMDTVYESNVKQFMRIAHVICPSRINLLTFTIAAICALLLFSTFAFSIWFL